MLADDYPGVPFGPPPEPIEVECVECGAIFCSSEMELRFGAGPDGDAAWCCANPDCNALGFLFDIWPTDPEWRDEHGELVCHCDPDETEFDGVVDDAILAKHWASDEWLGALASPHAGENIGIDVDGDAEHPLVRLFGDAAREWMPKLTEDDIPF